MDYDLGFQKNFKKKQQALSANMRYSSGVSESVMDIVEIYELLNYAPDNSKGLLQKSNDKQSQNNFIASVDYAHPTVGGENGKMETGYKTEIRKTDLDYDVQEFDDSSDVWYNLINVSNRFVYEESVHAGYVTYSNKIKRFSYLAGIRAEQTGIASKLIETNVAYRKNYLNFFPSIHLSQELAKENKIQLSYSRRIKRPRDRDINPFNSYADALNLWVGNPDLNPELTHSYEIGHLKYWESAVLGSSIYYRHTDSVIQRIRRIDTNGISIATPENFSTGDEFGVELTFSKDLFKWWKINGSLNYFRSIVDGGNLGNYSSNAYSYTGKINSTAVLWKDIQLQVMFNYRGPQETIQGLRKEMYFMDVGLKKDLLSKRASLMLKFGDVFNSKKHRMEFYGDNFVINTEYRRSTSNIVLSFTYKVNSYKPKERNKMEGDYNMDDMGM